MTSPEVLVLVRFKSALSFEEVNVVMEERIDDFRALNGLEQKYYIQDPQTGEYGGLYVWKTQEDFAQYRESELRASIGEAYKTEGEPRVEVLQVIRPLRD